MNFYQNGYTIGSPYYMTEVGEFENSASPYGTFDQGGNVLEWYEKAIVSLRGLRGGHWGDVSIISLHASDHTHGGYPSDEYISTGFRVASIPEPGSLAMLAGIALGTLLYWKRKHV